MTYQMTKEQMDELSSLQSNLYSMIIKLDGVIASDIVVKLTSMVEIVNDTLSPYNQALEKAWEDNSHALSVIAEENGFDTVWSMEEVPATQMNEKLPYSIKYMEYNGSKILVDGLITWLEAWRFANSLITKREDTNHIFIETFEQKDNGDVRLWTGS